MKLRISERMSKPDFQGDFTAAILKAAASPDVISFAGGLPNPDSFPVKEMEAAVTKVLERDGVRALQYSNTEGYLPLRKFISDRYKKQGIDFAPENIIITNGSQQALDMVAATLIDPGDPIAVEKPSLPRRSPDLPPLRPEGLLRQPERGRHRLRRAGKGPQGERPEVHLRYPELPEPHRPHLHPGRP